MNTCPPVRVALSWRHPPGRFHRPRILTARGRTQRVVRPGAVTPLPLSRGYTYIGLLFFVFLAGVGLAIAGAAWHMEVRRDREKELLFIGDQFRRAIASYHQSPAGKNQYPQVLEELLEDRRHPNPVRHLRQIYRDPMTGKADWTLIKEQERIIGVASSSEDKPVKSAGFPERYQDFNNATSYAAWRFIHRQTTVKADPATNPPLDGGGEAPKPGQQ